MKVPCRDCSCAGMAEPASARPLLLYIIHILISVIWYGASGHSRGQSQPLPAPLAAANTRTDMTFENVTNSHSHTGLVPRDDAWYEYFRI